MIIAMTQLVVRKKSIPTIKEIRSERVIPEKKSFATKTYFIRETDVSYLTGIKRASSTRIIW